MDFVCEGCGLPGRGTTKQKSTGLCSNCRAKKRYHNNKHRCPDCGTMHQISEEADS